MENNELNLDEKKAKRAALIIAIATFLGFCIVLFDRNIYGGGMASLIIVICVGLWPAGVLAAYLMKRLAYFIFIKYVKNKRTYWIFLVVSVIVSYVLGVLIFILAAMGMAAIFNINGKPYTNEISTHNNGKIDKWVYHHGTTTIVSFDTIGDGKPHIREYYKNGDLIKKEEISSNDKK